MSWRIQLWTCWKSSSSIVSVLTRNVCAVVHSWWLLFLTIVHPGSVCNAFGVLGGMRVTPRLQITSYESTPIRSETVLYDNSGNLTWSRWGCYWQTELRNAGRAVRTFSVGTEKQYRVCEAELGCCKVQWNIVSLRHQLRRQCRYLLHRVVGSFRDRGETDWRLIQRVVSGNSPSREGRMWKADCSRKSVTGRIGTTPGKWLRVMTAEETAGGWLRCNNVWCRRWQLSMRQVVSDLQSSKACGPGHLKQKIHFLTWSYLLWTSRDLKCGHCRSRGRPLDSG